MKKILLISLMFSGFYCANTLGSHATITNDQTNKRIKQMKQMKQIEDKLGGIEKAIHNIKNSSSCIKDIFAYLKEWFSYANQDELVGILRVEDLLYLVMESLTRMRYCNINDYEKIIDKVLEDSKGLYNRNGLYNGRRDIRYYKHNFEVLKKVYCNYSFLVKESFDRAAYMENVKMEDCAKAVCKIILDRMIASLCKYANMCRAENVQIKFKTALFIGGKLLLKCDDSSIKILGEEIIFFVNSIFNEGLVHTLISRYIHCYHDPNLQKEQKERCDKYINSLKDVTLNKICYMKKLSGSDKDAFSGEYSRYFDKCYEAIKNNYYSHRG